MRKIIAISFFMAAAAFPSLAGEPKNTYTSDSLGFSIEAPVSQNMTGPAYQIAFFFLPASDGFAANVTIQKQKYSESIDSYDKLSVYQFKTAKFMVINRELKNNEVIYEYKGSMQGKTFHWYSRAVKQDEHVYLVTAASLESHWEKQKTKLMQSVNSFRLKK